jgi:ubiquinone/menaquinone biosynthesis C-methylase UbiE
VTSSATPEGIHYLLGHTPHELRRLEIQGDLYRDETRRGFVAAGIEPGMSVLDIGCGTGDVSRVAASVVGESGSVLGIDRGPTAIETAAALSQAQGVRNTSFAVCEIEDVIQADDVLATGDHSHAPFDALVGRFILMHQPDPAQVLATAMKAIRPGGIVCMIESHMEVLMKGAHSFPHSPIYDEIVRWKGRVVGGAGADCHAGGRLRNIFTDAGLTDPHTTMHARLEGGPDSPYYEYIAQSVRSMLPEATRQGLGGFTEADVETMEERLRDEVLESGGVLVAWPTVVAYARVPGPA